MTGEKKSARWLVRLGYLAGIAVFLGLVAQFYLPGTGFTSLLSIGERLDRSAVTKFKNVLHYAYENSYGYDGTYYVQIALHPLLDEPELNRAVDNLPYRARRILPSWVAWMLGGGQAEWIVQAFALLNVVVWLALAGLLLRWLPPENWSNLLRWGGVLFSHGMCMSVRNSLVDAPGLLLVALAVAAIERGRRPGAVVALSAAVLTKETSLLATSAWFPERGTAGRGWWRAAGLGLLAALPFALWLMYVRSKVGTTSDRGLGNFAWPLQGLAEKCGVVLSELWTFGFGQPYLASLLVVVALLTQATFLLLRRRPAQPWWRVGASFAVLMLVVAQPVWEGYPGAATRVLLPMTLAFNLLVPRSRKWLPLLVAGNLSAIVGVGELTAPPHESFRITGARAVRAEVKLERGTGWYVAEAGGGRQWRWSSGDARLRLRNEGSDALTVTLRGEISAVKSEREITIRAGDEIIWSGLVGVHRQRFESKPFVLPSGGAGEIQVGSKQPGERFVNGDSRVLAFAVYDLDIAIARAEAPAKGETP